jgi:ribosomal protein S18 acetylase RimI-like enzyme
MNDQVLTRTAVRSDLDAVVGLAIRLGRDHARRDPRRFDLSSFEPLADSYARFFAGELANPAADVIVATSGSSVVGYAFARVEPASLLDLSPGGGWIHDLYVAEPGRGRGVGTALVTEAVGRLRARGARTIHLAVATANTAAAAWFAELGFSPVMSELVLDRDG